MDRRRPTDRRRRSRRAGHASRASSTARCGRCSAPASSTRTRTRATSSCGRAGVVYLDFGMMSTLAERQRRTVESVIHMVNRDFEALAALYGELGFIAEGTDPRRSPRRSTALPDVLNNTMRELNLKSVFERLGDVMYDFLHAAAVLRRHHPLPRRARGRGPAGDEGFALIQGVPVHRIAPPHRPVAAAAARPHLLLEPPPTPSAGLGRLRWDYLEALLTQAAETANTTPRDAVAACRLPRVRRGRPSRRRSRSSSSTRLTPSAPRQPSTSTPRSRVSRRHSSRPAGSAVAAAEPREAAGAPSATSRARRA